MLRVRKLNKSQQYDFEIVNVIKKSDPSEIVDQLIAAVLGKGAPDNVTIIWAEIVETKVESPSELLGAASI